MYNLQAITSFLLLFTSLVQAQTIVFNPSSYFVQFDEEQPDGTSVTQVKASYLNSFGLIRTDGSFSIPSTGDAQYFTIETNSSLSETVGTLRASAVFDRDSPNAQTTFSFVVTYTTPDSNSDSVPVNVILRDINDNSPQFTQRTYAVPLLETMLAGTPFFTPTAIDPDLTVSEERVVDITPDVQDVLTVYTISNGRIFYNITAGNELGHFVIDSETGVLSISEGVVLNIDAVDLYNLTIMATDGGGLNDNATVCIGILDINDNPPQILSPLGVNLTIPEDTPPGYLVVDRINTTDLDRGVNAEVRFAIISGDITNSFSIDELSGRIEVSAPLDRERGAIITLTVEARDLGLPQSLANTIQVVINLLDLNDYTPQFSQSSYTISVFENSQPPAVVDTLEAIDLDEGPNGTVTYAIIEGGDGKFVIDNSTGVIRTTVSLDHEERDSYQLVVRAFDNPLNSSYQLSSVVNVTILVDDVNDNGPIFLQREYNASILDNQRRRTEILRVMATDEDAGLNGEIRYLISVPDPTDSDAFLVDETSGVIYRERRIVFEDQDVYTFTVQAIDRSSTPLADTTVVTIYIHNVNENPPVFDQSEYNATIVETTSIATVVLHVSAQDPDIGLIGELRYRIVSEFDAAGSFGVDKFSGEVFVESRLDFDVRDFVFFVVEAYDGGFPEPLTDRTNVTVYLVGENDEAPSIIFPDGFYPTVPENESPRIEVVTLSEYTSDPDLGLGGEFAFRLVGIFDEYSQNDSFSFNETTSVITSLRIFDREQQPEGIRVAIETIDFGSPQQSKVTNVTIMIGDKNDNAPYFESNATAEVYEFMPPGIRVPLANFTALDDDIDINAMVEYEIFGGEGAERFAIDPVSGVIRTTEILNKTVQQFYNLTIIALDQGTPQLFGFGSVFIEVIDANDQVPLFSESVYSASLLEAAPLDTFVTQVNATDTDIGTNAVFEYFISPNSTNFDLFTINSTSGEIFSNAVFDRENISVIDIEVSAVDSGLVPLTGSATVRVFIQDINDHPPVFNNSLYSANITENAPNNTVVATVLALDADAENPNNNITYSLHGNRSETFAVDSITGNVLVAGEIDWELGEEFTITVLATDGGLPNMTDAALLTIFIEDVNDVAPQFVPSSLNLSIFENTPPGNTTVVGTVRANDPDSPGNNSRITYSILMDFSNGRFELDSESGLVTFVRHSLDRENRDLYDLLIRASDHGNPQLHTDATLYISVTDSNEFSPVFDREVYRGSVEERVATGTAVLTLEATDIDVDLNGELRYSILDSSVTHLFRVDPVTGVLATANDPLDFESVKMYRFQVGVTDLGSPQQFNDTALVVITVLDSNDHEPRFEESIYTAVLRENLASGTVLLRAIATDADSGTNAEIEYTLPPEVGEYLGVDPLTGVLYTRQFIDREVTPEFNFTITANNSAAEFPLHSTVDVFINVTDLNDMHPTFEPIVNVRVPESTANGTVILTLGPVDGDEGRNGTISFSLLQGNEEYFALDEQSGNVTLLRELDFEARQLYILTVMASDFGTPSLSNYTNVFVHVLDENDNAPQFFAPIISTTISFITDVGSFVANLEAYDADSQPNGQLEFSIQSGNELGLFELSSSSEGIVQTAGSLSSYAGMTFSLTVTVSNPGVGRSDSGTVVVSIDSGQVSSPRFTSQNFSTSLLENSSPGTSIFDFVGLSINVDTYSVNFTNIFSIDPATGVVTLNSSTLDYESQRLFLLTVEGRAAGVSEPAYTVLRVDIEDENEYAPQFTSDSFFIALPETTPTIEPFFVASATDRDGASPANDITYSIATSNTTVLSFFGINRQTGELFLRRNLDYEFGVREFNFSISAENDMSTFSEANVSVVVLNGNTFSPEFDQSRYVFVFDENMEAGLSIVNVSATDRDEGSHGDVTYGLHGNHDYLDVRIDTYTGHVFFNNQLDYERHTFYSLVVVAGDGGNPGRSSTASILIQIVDLNDNTPVWESAHYAIVLSENVTVGTVLINVTATDADQVDRDASGIINVNNGLVSYSIIDGDSIGQFSVAIDTGLITLASSLNREEVSEYNLTLRATDGGGRYAEAYLHITLTDVNDQVPAFTESPYLVGLPENSPNGTLVLTVVATDTDLRENAIVMYRFSNSSGDYLDSSGTFFLNDTTGEIFTNASIDRETISEYVLSVEAADMGATPLTGVVEVIVQIIDINEFTPVFTAAVFNGSVFENEPVGVSVLQVDSTDEDFEENSTILYSIVEGNSLALFSIIPETGVIEVAGSIDFESVQEVELVVMATDTGPIETRLTSVANVTVNILDRNDNTPQLEDSYRAFISENSAPGDTVLIVAGNDSDSGSNAELTYFLDSLGDTEVERIFNINPSTGEIYLSNISSLEREITPSYSFLVNVTDGGTPPLSSSSPVTVNITDINDNVPQFTAAFFEGYLSENLQNDTLVVTVEATDEDVGINADIVFSILSLVQNQSDCVDSCNSHVFCDSLLQNQASAIDVPFSIDALTGEVSSTRPLNREAVASYVIMVRAADSAVNETQLSNLTCVFVTVLDQNDEVPVFSQDVFTASISEYSTMGEPVTQVLADDGDIMSNAEITFELATESASFTIHPSSGVITTLVGTYDREARDLYNVTVVARDGGTPSLSSSAFVMVTILDENDSPPVFSQSAYDAAVRENLPSNTTVVTVSATDEDIGTNALLSYSIASVSPPTEHFIIDPSSGALLTAQPLDREDIERYIVTVIASDGGSPSLNASTVINVEVLDENDLPPVFTKPFYSARINENTLSIKSSLLNITAMDGDQGTNADVYFTLESVSPPSDAFELSVTSGELFVTSELDAEYSLNYTLTVNASNGAALPAQSAKVTVDIQVTDLNDNTPYFELSDYVTPLSEATPIGSDVITLIAFDEDATSENSELSFEISGGHNTSLFGINSTTGVVYVAGILDRETEPRHTLMITASDNGSPRLTTNTTLMIILQDFNDNSPVFEQSSYSFRIDENSPVSSLVGRLQATDLDLQNVSYSLINASSFQINSTSGEIFTAAVLDREEQEVYTFIAVVTDVGSTIQHTDAVNVTVTLNDLNDVTPVFQNSTYDISWHENTTVGAVLLTVTALDEDLRESSALRYDILPGNDSSFFSINATSGEITLEAEFDREEQDEFLFSITATDMGAPPLTGTAAVRVLILDNNDNVPVLNSTTYTMSLPEDTAVSSLVLVVGATDRDIDENANISFSLSEDFGGMFSIGEQSGVLTLTGSLDYEMVRSYSFFVVATDDGEGPLSNSSQVYIEVVDLNDNPPIFDSDIYTVSIPENSILGSSVFQIPATDADSTTNSELRYTILSGNLGGVFAVDEVFGLISTADYLDREITPTYSLGLRVVDLGIPQFTATAVVDVTVQDVNDNAPRFESSTYSVSIAESLGIGMEFITVSALDLDIGPNANLSYRIIGGNTGGTFEIGPITGTVRTTHLLDYESIPSYALTVLVSDNSLPFPLTDTTVILISLSDVNEHPPTFLDSAYFVNVSENAVVGTVVGYFIATDRDPSSALQYALSGGEGHFGVDMLEGSVYVSNPLMPGSYALALEASDDDHVTNITVYVTVVPLSLASTLPLFSQPAFLFEVSEAAATNSVVGIVSNSAAEIFNGSDVFDVNANGSLILIGRLDYETTPTYVLNVEATYSSTEPPLFSMVTVRVLDENDNAPVFESSEYSVVVSEIQEIGTSLLTLRVFDSDSPGVNEQANITISEVGNEREKFAIDRLTGDLVLVNSLDYEEQAVYNVTVVATNTLASPVLSSTAHVVVQVTDTNDNDPVFSQTIYQVTILESIPLGMEILNLEAEDIDSGSNSELVFSITHLSTPHSFSINTTAGTVQTNMTFNLTQDATSSYVISALVSDRGSPQPRSDTATIFIDVIPDNFYPPQFSQPSGYQVEIPETVSVGYIVTEVAAVDPDDPTGMLQFSIVSGDTSGKFTIAPSTGLIELASTLDYLEQSLYTLTVSAVDFGAPPRTSYVGVNISVIDINNHNPEFTELSYEVDVVENITTGSYLIQTTATDPDALTLTYQITVNVLDNDLDLFSINSTTGEIFTAAVIDREFADVLEILVSAIDSGYPIQRSQSVVVRIVVQDLNDNPPEFSQPSYSFSAVKLLDVDQPVGMVMATDADIVGEELTYSITNDSSAGLFRINPVSGQLFTTRVVPVTLLPGYELAVTVFDGKYNTSVAVDMLLVDDGDFCNAGGYCTLVREVNCTYDVFPYVDCNAFCTGELELYPESTGMFNPLPRVCVSHYCMETSLVPCVAIETCLPLNQACVGVCPEGMSVCPTTDLCHVTSLSGSCDETNETCLIGQTLVQRSDNSRYCNSSESLPPSAQNCSSRGLVFCEALSKCHNLTEPYLCQACPGDLVLCPDTGECVSDAVRCCGSDGYFCDVLGECVENGTRCELPNIPPVAETPLIYLETIEDFEPASPNEGHVISMLLGNSSEPAVDSQGEEISIAIVQASIVQTSYGEWQYTLCEDVPANLTEGCSSYLSSWTAIDPNALSETNALVLPSSARIRFNRKAIELDGAVWLRVKIWDGNDDGFIKYLVRSRAPSFENTLPFTPTSAYSERTSLLAVIILPLISQPTFNPEASLQLASVDEDVVFADNLGNQFSEFVLSVDIPNFQVLIEERIEGLVPSQGFSAEEVELLLPVGVREAYYRQVPLVNPTRRERVATGELGQSPGVAVSFASESVVGTWQVSLSGDPRQFVDLNSVLTNSQNGEILLLNTYARLRLLPASEFCGSEYILVRPWDGYWNQTVSTPLESGFLRVSSPEANSSLSALSSNNLNEWERVGISVNCVQDTPVILADQVSLDPIPYRIAYRYERVFTVAIDRVAADVREERSRLADFLQLSLQVPVDIKKISPALNSITSVSFSVQNDVLSFEEVSAFLQARLDSLSLLGFPVTDIVQDVAYGPGAGCHGDQPQHYHGVHVNTFFSRFTYDGDADFVGVAVVSIDTSTDGVWQYHRGNWSSNENRADEYDPLSNAWINFPSSSQLELSETNALLLHGNDRLRYLPHPDMFWGGSPDYSTPSISVKVWDGSVDVSTPSSEASILNINTSPIVDTAQSLLSPQGRFSDSVLVVEAARFGCDGLVNSGIVHDACCVCGGAGDSCEGCGGVMGSDTVQDACDVCGVALESSCFGCDFIPFSGTESGPCSECISGISIPTNSSTDDFLFLNAIFTDCNGDCYGNAILDSCDVCSGGTTSHEPDSDRDCAGVCSGAAVIDSCGDCTGPGTSLQFNQNIDCTGVCGGPFVTDSCGVCQLANENGGVTENRDCAGVCYGEAVLDVCEQCVGGATNFTAGYSLDECGVCEGDNTSCVGCEGRVASGVTVDSCGECGGNNCGCFQLDSVTPNRAPRTGATELTIRGAGFFLNDTNRLGFEFNRDLPNCGAPYTFPDTVGNSVRITCRFRSGDEQHRVPALPVDQSTIRCNTPPITSLFRDFVLEIEVENDPFSNPIPFYYDDYSDTSIDTIMPPDLEVGTSETVSFFGTGFINTSSQACLVYDFVQCSSDQRASRNPLVIPAIFVSESRMSCQLPPADVPCQVTLRLSLDGQESGRISTPLTVFTYRYSSPLVESVHFSSDLSKLIIQFDRQVDLSPSTSLNCSEILDNKTISLIGREAVCSWSDNSQRQLVISLPRTANVQVKSSISLADDAIVTRHQLYSYAAAGTPVLVDSVRNVVPPLAVLNGPSSIPACGQFTFSGSHSQFPGYGGLEYYWTIHVSASTITNYREIVSLVESYGLHSPEITLDSNLFLPRIEYYLQLYVVSSIGLQSEIESVRLVKDDQPRPFVIIPGAASRVLSHNEDLVILSTVVLPQCIDSQRTYAYTWILTETIDQRRSVFSEIDLSTLKTSSSSIVIPESFLRQGTDYTLAVIVTVSRVQESIRAEVGVSILPAPLQAHIVGGDRTVSQSREIVLNGRSSVYPAGLTSISWSCQVVGSLDACYNRTESGLIPTPISLPRTDFISFPAAQLESGKRYVFSLRLEQEGESSSASVTVEIVASQTPLVEISTPMSVVSSESVILEGFVFTAVPVESVYWESLDVIGQGTVDLSGSAVVQSQTTYEAVPLLNGSIMSLPTSISTDVTNRANLILAPNALIPGLAYTFRLTTRTNEETAYSQVTFTPSAPPQLTNLVATPMSGVALETNFILEAVNTVDNPEESPFLYAFGTIVGSSNIDLRTTSVPDHMITWLSGVLPSARVSALLPTPSDIRSSKVTLLVRVLNRNGGSSDSLVEVDVLPNSNLADETSYAAVVSGIGDRLGSTKAWNDALSHLMATTLELNSRKLTNRNTRTQILDIFESIFDTYLPPSVINYQLAASLLSHLTENGGIADSTQHTRVITITKAILQWFDNQIAFQQRSESVPTQGGNVPLYLQSSYTRGRRGILSDSSVINLLSPLTNLVAVSPTTQLSKEYVQIIDLATTLLCKRKSAGQDPSNLSNELSNIFGSVAQPRGAFNVSGVIVNFQDSLTALYQTEACSINNSPCLETCISGASFESDYLGNTGSQVLQLDTDIIDMLISEIEGSNPQNVEIFSDVISTSVSIPSQSSYLEVSNLNSNIQIAIPLREPVPNGSRPLCLYREIGGGKGFDGTRWRLDTTSSPEIVSLSGQMHVLCEFNHLTEFVIGLLPPPIITPPPTTAPPTTTEITTEITTPTTPPTTEATTVPPEPVPFPAAAVAIVLILIMLVVAGIAIFLIAFFVWKKKRSKKLQISPATDETDGDAQAQLTKAGPLTPEESKVPMQIILCAESGDRKLIGKMNVLPSIRLRELRYQLGDNFDMFKNKPFYFLTRQLCDIEPSAEQQQFVSLVFGDKPIFVREVSAENELTKKHFCVCGNAAQFECSNCSCQGYCSPECQLQHWGEQHQRQCNRLSEKRKRSDILSSRPGPSGATSPVNQRPQGLLGRSRRVTAPSAVSPGTPTDWKGFMNSGKTFQQQTPASPQRSVSTVVPPRSSLGELARPLLNQQLSPRSPPTLGPLKKVSVASRTLPPLSRSTSFQGSTQFASRPSYQTPTHSTVSRTVTPNMYGASPVAPPNSLRPAIRSQPDLFTKTNPVHETASRPQPVERRISITSIGSEDLGFSVNIPRDLRHEPLLESDEEDYETSSSSGNSSSPSPQLLKAPPTTIPTLKIHDPQSSGQPSTEAGATAPGEQDSEQSSKKQDTSGNKEKTNTTDKEKEESAHEAAEAET